jgi:ferric-dicitrate binding protein FerR (iron transport regulator)
VKENSSDIFHYLITNRGFVDWVKKPNENSNYFWKKWVEEHPELISDVKRSREFVERMQFKKTKLSPSELDEMMGKVLSHEPTASRPISKWGNGIPLVSGFWLRIAAILLLALLAGVMIENMVFEIKVKPSLTDTEWRTVENPKGRKSKITLPDGTLVNLNYESQLKFPKVFKGNSRKVELIGEAFFDVVHLDSMPFIVQANGIETEVLGTSFNIKSFAVGKETEISLVTGKVKVKQTKGGGSVKNITQLSPGEQLTFDRNSGEMVKGTFNVERITSWKEGVILFKDAGFEEFIHQLEKWYGVDFQIYGTPSKKWRINGRYQHEKLDDILMGLRFVYDIEYKFQGKNVILKIK